MAARQSAKQRIDNALPAAAVPLLERVDGGLDALSLLNAIITEFGGHDNFARAFYRDYCAATGMAKKGYIELINRLVVVTTQAELSKPKSAAELTDDEIEAELRGLVEKFSGQPNV